MKALLWKEWKEIRWMWVVTFIILLLLIPITGWDKDSLFPLAAGFIVMISGWFIGARAFAKEQILGTTDYLKTRPIHPVKIVLIKYFVGIIYICSLILIWITITAPIYEDNIKLIHLIPEVWYGISTIFFWEILLAFILYYSIYFLFSIIFQDTIRAFILGFIISGILFWTLHFIYSSYDNPFSIDSSLLYLIRGLLGLIQLELIIVPILIWIYYRIYYKRFVWNTIFLLFIPLSIMMGILIYPIFRGNIELIHHNPYMNIGQRELYYWNNNIYRFEYQQNFQQLLRIDMKDVLNPIEKPVMSLQIKSQPRFESNQIYLIEEIQQNTQLVVYEIDSDGIPKEIHQITYTQDTDIYPLMFSRGNNVIIYYSIKTGIIYRDKYGNPATKGNASESHNIILRRHHIVEIDKNSWEIIKQYEIPSIESFRTLLWDPVYGEYCFHIKDSTINIYPVSEWLTPNPIAILQLPDENFLFNVIGNYLYVTSSKYPLEIYDISNIYHPHKVGSINWNWIDKLDFPKQFRNIEYTNLTYGGISIIKDKAIVFYNRGFMIFDISNPNKPLLIGKMNTDKILSYTYNDEYLYASGAGKGFSIYPIP